MPARLPVASKLRTRNPFPIRVVVSALRALADDLTDIEAGKTIHLTERVQWVRKSVQQAEAWLALLHIVCDRAGFTAQDARELANQYQSVMTTRRTPIRRFTAGGARTSPLLPTMPMDVAKAKHRKEVDGA